MTFGVKLERLRDRAAFPPLGHVEKRWGQLLREQPSLSVEFQTLVTNGTLVPLSRLARLHSGVVTRANAFFIVRELPFASVPHRFGLTRKDYDKNAVVLDGVESPFRIEREFLKPLIKGPEDLRASLFIRETDLRLFDVREGRKELQDKGATGAITYIRRGETFDYRKSSDDLKGGIPAQRAQVKVRKPYWYSLGVPDRKVATIVVPEHYDRRYIASEVTRDDESVINDTLYSVTPYKAEHLRLILWSLNSLLGWYQIELRGRTQHGQGVLKVKIPDFEGLLVLNPDRADSSVQKGLAGLFKPVGLAESSDSLSSLADVPRNEFDEAVLRTAGFSDPARARAQLETQLRAAVAERRERRLSVADAKIDRRKVRGDASLDALATRMAAGSDLFPDPRDFVGHGVALTAFPVLTDVEGPLRVGTELFSQNEVYAGDTCIARLEDALSAHFVKGVLLRDPGLKEVQVPARWALERIVGEWDAACKAWHHRFEETAALTLRHTTDERTKREATNRALILLHAL
ncbi:MAG TPA: hypothetical protein VEW71_01350 [Allosphingosinicella sp.]|nr:hypothetical protein [Allosphingosinicella sp.]